MECGVEVEVVYLHGIAAGHVHSTPKRRYEAS